MYVYCQEKNEGIGGKLGWGGDRFDRTLGPLFADHSMVKLLPDSDRDMEWLQVCERVKGRGGACMVLMHVCMVVWC